LDKPVAAVIVELVADSPAFIKLVLAIRFAFSVLLALARESIMLSCFSLSCLPNFALFSTDALMLPPALAMESRI